MGWMGILMSQGKQNMIVGDVNDGYFRLAMMFNDNRLAALDSTNDLSRITGKFRFACMNYGVHI
jgi:hypothetical protein